jgi:hypothetical protein
MTGPYMEEPQMSAAPSFAARTRRAAAGCLALVALAACSSDAPNVIAPPTAANLAAVGRQDDLGPALAAQAKHTNRLLSDRDVLGTGVGRLTDGRPEVTVFARNASAAAKVPRDLDGIPVVVEVTGDITILPQKADASPRARPGGGGGTQPTDFFTRPVPIGVSTGRADECAAGTIGARVKSGSSVYALSNNHVFAAENAGQPGDPIWQPGRYDLACATNNTTNDATYRLGTLSKNTTISFSKDNVVDGAIASVDVNHVGKSTPSNGYGTPSSTATTAALNMAVQKYGRTTGLTTGVVTGVSVTINVQYTDGVARFINQIQIRGDKGAFSRAGDSGSLIVTRSGNQAVGLLFAGGQTSTFANPIAAVLSQLGVSIDGTP